MHCFPWMLHFQVKIHPFFGVGGGGEVEKKAAAAAAAARRLVSSAHC